MSQNESQGRWNELSLRTITELVSGHTGPATPWRINLFAMATAPNYRCGRVQGCGWEERQCWNPWRHSGAWMVWSSAGRMCNFDTSPNDVPESHPFRVFASILKEAPVGTGICIKAYRLTDEFVMDLFFHYAASRNVFVILDSVGPQKIFRAQRTS